VPHRRRSFVGSDRTSQRRLTSWDLGPGGDDLPTLDVQSITASSTAIMGSGVTPAVDRFTVVRLRGFVEIRLVAASSGGDGYNYNIGIGRASLDAFTAGVASLPNPFDDILWPGWMWHHSGSIRTAVAGAVVGDPSINPQLISIDTKAMRTLRNNEVLFMSLQGGETGTATLQFRGMTRMLVKLA